MALTTDPLLPAGGRFLKAPAARAEQPDVSAPVAAMLDELRRDGVDAVRRFSARLDAWEPETFRVSAQAREEAVASLTPELRGAFDFALERVREFARHQLACMRPLDVETLPGIRLGHRLMPVGSVGAYVPGGRYPLIASAFMTIAVAKVAGVGRVVAVAPPKAGAGIDPVQLAAMELAGADEIFAVGGVQALGALAYGLGELGPPVDMLVGAGNVYVTEAKRQLFGDVGIEALAGPSELTILADDTADANVVVHDLLGQAEHGPTSIVNLVTPSARLADAVLALIPQQLSRLPTREVAEIAWRDYGSVVVCENAEEAVAVVNHLAPEHLEVQTEDLDWCFERLTSYGTVFLGADATVAYSDKAIGTNHVLPTQRAARYTGGLWVGSFIRVLTHQRVEPLAATRVAESTVAIATAEGLAGHAESARIRLPEPTPVTPRGETT